MIKPITSIVSLARQARAISIPLLAVGALAAGCATTSSSSAPVTGGSRAASPASATPVPTVSGGPVVAGEPACAGWPASVPSAPLPASFVPATVERCVTGSQAIAGQGQWVTATLEQANTGLAGLVNALRHPTVTHTPGTVCSALVIIPPQIVLISDSGKKLIPRLPVSGCGLVQSEVLVALNALPWHPVSVRLISKVPATPAGGSTAPTGASAPVPAPSSQSSGGMQP